VEQKVLSRIEKDFNSQLNAKNKFTAFNFLAIPVAAYTLGVVKWPDTEFQAFDREIRGIAR
jgi:hypothetical protein